MILVLDGKVVLVTGATDGLGRALAADLVRSGATVLVHGRDPRRIADTVGQLTAAGSGAPASRVRSYQADLSSLAGARSLAERVIAVVRSSEAESATRTWLLVPLKLRALP